MKEKKNLTVNLVSGNDNSNNQYFEYLSQLEAEGYYGEVVINFQNGKITHMNKKESIKFK